jgi:prevent-host-death family protein
MDRFEVKIEEVTMQVAVSEAKGQLLELVRRAEKGEEVVLTRHGQAIARLVPMAPDAAERRAALEEARGAACILPALTLATVLPMFWRRSGAARCSLSAMISAERT